MTNKLLGILLSMAILLVFSLFSKAQPRIPIRDIENKAKEKVLQLYAEIKFVSSHIKSSRYQWRNIRSLFTRDALVQVSSNNSNSPNIRTRTAKEYFDRLAILCPGTYDSVTFTIPDGVVVDARRVACYENVKCEVTAEVRQFFYGWKNGKKVYSDCTVRVIEMVFTRGVYGITGQLARVTVSVNQERCN